jgi:hypothetical protein
VEAAAMVAAGTLTALKQAARGSAPAGKDAAEKAQFVASLFGVAA